MKRITELQLKKIINNAVKFALEKYDGTNLTKFEKYGKCGLVDDEGRIVVPCIYNDIESFEDNGLARVMKNGKNNFIYGVIDVEGREIVPCTFDNIKVLEDYIYVKKYGKSKVMDKEGNEISSVWFDMIEPFIEGVAHVRKDGKWGYMDSEGELIVPCVYEWRDDLESCLNDN